MRRVILVCVVFVALVAVSPRRADALTVRDVLELSRAGVGDEVLLALIEVDRSVFPIDTATLKSLKEAGISERVIVAMVRSARGQEPQPEPVFQPEDIAPQPQVIVIDHHDDAPEIREVPVAVPVYIPVVRRSHERDRDRDGDVRETDPFGDRSPRDKHGKDHEPVYWGWGGKLRPDAWKPR